MPQLLLTIPQSDYDAAAFSFGIQTADQFSSGAESAFLFSGAAGLKGATIQSAVLRVRNGNTASAVRETKLMGEAADDALPFTGGEPYANFTARPVTAAKVDWDLAGLLLVGQRLDSPDLAAVVQEVVGRAGFVDRLHLLWKADGQFPPTHFYFDWHPSVAAELLIDYQPQAADSVLVEAANAIVAALAAGAFSQVFTPVRSWAQWQRHFESAEAVGLQVDVVPVVAMEDELSGRKVVQYSPAIDVVVRKKFAAEDLEEVPGENESRVKFEKVAELVALLEEIHQALTAERLGAAGPDPEGQVVWQDDRILATYVPTHLRNYHQYTGVVRITTKIRRSLG